MRVLLRHPKTGRFYQAARKWTDDPTAARDFEHSAQALFFAQQQNLTGAEILMSFEDPGYDFVVARVEPAKRG